MFVWPVASQTLIPLGTGTIADASTVRGDRDDQVCQYVAGQSDCHAAVDSDLDPMMLLHCGQSCTAIRMIDIRHWCRKRHQRIRNNRDGCEPRRRSPSKHPVSPAIDLLSLDAIVIPRPSFMRRSQQSDAQADNG